MSSTPFLQSCTPILEWAYTISGNYDKAFDEYQEALHLDARFLPAHFRLAEYYLARRMYAQAIHETALDEAYAGDPQRSFDTKREYRTNGFSGVLRSEVEAARRDAGERTAALQLGRSYALLGRKYAAMQALSTLYHRHDPSLIYLKVDPALAPLRSDPRFQDLERRCGLTP
jgi:thioredoxin-like negative regulator of GroEL